MTILEYPQFETFESLAKKMEISKEGLSTDDAQKNLSLYGYNEIKEKKHNLFILFLPFCTVFRIFFGACHFMRDPITQFFPGFAFSKISFLIFLATAFSGILKFSE